MYGLMLMLDLASTMTKVDKIGSKSQRNSQNVVKLWLN